MRVCVEMEHSHSVSVLLSRFSPKASLTAASSLQPLTDPAAGTLRGACSVGAEAGYR